MLALWGNLKKDYSEKNQLKQIDMLRMILEINQDVVVYGISKLEDYENNTTNFPLLCRGVKLVRGGMEPQTIESVLLNAAFSNDVQPVFPLSFPQPPGGAPGKRFARPPRVSLPIPPTYWRVHSRASQVRSPLLPISTHAWTLCSLVQHLLTPRIP